ncbi:MAG: hypothetical protein R2749_30095 [Acidimicrobiales bacterium]
MTSTVPDLVRDLALLGVRVHGVEPGGVTLEDRLLAILRHADHAHPGAGEV